MQGKSSKMCLIGSSISSFIHLALVGIIKKVNIFLTNCRVLLPEFIISVHPERPLCKYYETGHLYICSFRLCHISLTHVSLPFVSYYSMFTLKPANKSLLEDLSYQNLETREKEGRENIPSQNGSFDIFTIANYPLLNLMNILKISI